MQHIAQAWIHELLLKAPFIEPLGVELVSTASDRVHIRLPFREDLSGIGDHVHSGVIAALVEFAGTVAAVSGISDDDRAAGCITSQLSLTYLSPPHGRYVDAVATVVHRTERQTVTDISVYRDDGGTLAKATAICRIFEQPVILTQAA